MSFRIIQGDALERLRDLPAESVQTCVTSPPYWGLRDYGTAEWEGGDSECDHKQDTARKDGGRVGVNGFHGSSAEGSDKGAMNFRDICGKCGAKRIDSQLGLEPTPEQYVSNLVAVFREVRRVLRDDGTVWLNLGDSYASNWPCNRRSQIGAGSLPNGKREARPSRLGGLKEKDLVGIPWRVAFALQADGWWLRSDIIWSKPNPMPESVTDRPTRAHEYLFLLAKGQWKTRVIQFADLPSERFHLLDYLSAENPRLGPIPKFCVRHASTILDRAKSQEGVSLPSLDSEVWQQGSDGSDSDFVRGLPVEHRPAVWAARFLSANASAKQFLEEIDRLRITLPNDGDLLVGGGLSGGVPLPPGITRDREAAITIHDAGEVCKIDFANHTVEFRRPTRCSYFYDADAIREPHTTDGAENNSGQVDQSLLARPKHGEDPRFRTRPGSRPSDYFGHSLGRNKRSVWEITTQPYAEAHFATFPPKLIEPCILAGSPPKCCGECGTPWERGIERETATPGQSPGYNRDCGARNDGDRAGSWTDAKSESLGWRPACNCLLKCPNCGVEFTHDGRYEEVRDVRPEVHSPALEEEAVLQSDMREPIPLAAQSDGKGEIHDQQRLRLDPSAEPSERIEGRLRDGASAGDGANVGPGNSTERSGASPERGQGGQPYGESAGDAEADTRHAPETSSSSGDRAVSSLRGDSSTDGTCPSCGSTPEQARSVVLDIFCGSGTTGVIALRHNRDFIGIELNPDYCEMARNRIRDDAPLFNIEAEYAQR